MFLFLYVRIYLLFANVFRLLNLQKIAKKENPINLICCLFTYFSMNGIIFVLMFLLSMHVVNFMFWICMLWIWNNQWLRIIILRSLEKGALWKFWLDPRFPRNPKLEWILKWLPLDKGYFKVYFYKSRKSFNNLMPYVSSDS